MVDSKNLLGIVIFVRVPQRQALRQIFKYKQFIWEVKKKLVGKVRKGDRKGNEAKKKVKSVITEKLELNREGDSGGQSGAVRVVPPAGWRSSTSKSHMFRDAAGSC